MMRAALIFAIVLTGCPGAMLLSAATQAPQKGYAHPPNAKDYESWIGTSQADLETHQQFALLPRETRPVSDGSSLWIFRHCPAHGRRAPNAEDCCLFEFVLREAVVTRYRTAGECAVNCSMRPDSKVQACINDTVVPDSLR